MAKPKYGPAHVAERKQWKQRIVNGERPPCSRCGQYLEPEDARSFHLDHDDDGVNYLGPAHALCNTSAAGKKAQKLRRIKHHGPKRPRSQDW